MSIGRVGNNQLTRKLLANVNDQLKLQEKLFEQISTNKRILKPSDDPLGTSKSMGIRDQINRSDEYSSVISSAEVWTNISNSALDSATDSWRRVNEIAISAADGTKSAADRAGMAEELEQLLGHLVSIGNSTHAGRYVFGGSQTDSAPFSTETDASTGRITGVYYGGNSDLREIKTRDHGTTEISVLGSNAGNPDEKGAFIDSNEGVNIFETVINLRDKLLANDTVGISGSGGIIEGIETAGRSITAAQVRLGGAQEALLLDRNHLIEQSSNLEQSLADIEDADVAELILELNNVQNVYEAALAAGGRLLQTGLVNFI